MPWFDSLALTYYPHKALVKTGLLAVWAAEYGLSNFEERDKKLDPILPKNLNTQWKILYLSNCQKVPKSDFQS